MKQIIKHQAIMLMIIYLGIWALNQILMPLRLAPNEQILFCVLLPVIGFGLFALLTFQDLPLNHSVQISFFSIVLSATPTLRDSKILEKFFSFSPDGFLIVLTSLLTILIIFEAAELVKWAKNWKALIPTFLLIVGILYAPQIMI